MDLKVKTNSNTINLLYGYKRFVDKITPETQKAHDKAMQYGIKKFEEYSSATAYSTRNRIRAKGYRGPYSRVKPNPPLPPYFINKQSGEFNRSFKIKKIGVTNSVIENTAPHAVFLNGKPTALMIGRPIIQKVAPMILKKRNGLLSDAFRKARGIKK